MYDRPTPSIDKKKALEKKEQKLFDPHRIRWHDGRRCQLGGVGVGDVIQIRVVADVLKVAQVHA